MATQCSSSRPLPYAERIERELVNDLVNELAFDTDPDIGRLVAAFTRRLAAIDFDPEAVGAALEDLRRALRVYVVRRLERAIEETASEGASMMLLGHLLELDGEPDPSGRVCRLADRVEDYGADDWRHYATRWRASWWAAWAVLTTADDDEAAAMALERIPRWVQVDPGYSADAVREIVIRHRESLRDQG